MRYTTPDRVGAILPSNQSGTGWHPQHQGSNQQTYRCLSIRIMYIPKRETNHVVTDTQVVLLLIQIAESDIVANRERDPLHRYASRSGSSPIETRRRLNSILIVNLLSLKRIEIVM